MRLTSPKRKRGFGFHARTASRTATRFVSVDRRPGNYSSRNRSNAGAPSGSARPAGENGFAGRQSLILGMEKGDRAGDGAPIMTGGGIRMSLRLEVALTTTAVAEGSVLYAPKNP